MKLSAFSTNCGVLVEEIELANITENELLQIKQAFNKHGLLFFRDQQLTEQQHLDFSLKIGPLTRNRFFKSVPHFPDIAIVKKEAEQTTNIGGGWHTDHSYDREPALGSILLARELPRSGGDTRFANLAAVYSALPEILKTAIANKTAIHSIEHIYGKNGYYSQTDMANNITLRDDNEDATHPCVIRHPESGKKILYVNPAHTIGFTGQSYEQSKPLLEQLYQFAEQPEFTCQFDWQPGSMAMWDNRMTWHFAQNDYHGERRLMHRITLQGGPLSA